MKFPDPIAHYRRSLWQNTALGWVVLWGSSDVIVTFAETEEQARRIVDRIAELLAVIEEEEAEVFTSG